MKISSHVSRCTSWMFSKNDRSNSSESESRICKISCILPTTLVAMYTDDLIAATLMTFSVLEGRSLLQAFQVQYFIFVARHAVSEHLPSFLLLNYMYSVSIYRTCVFSLWRHERKWRENEVRKCEQHWHVHRLRNHQRTSLLHELDTSWVSSFTNCWFWFVRKMNTKTVTVHFFPMIFGLSELNNLLIWLSSAAV